MGFQCGSELKFLGFISPIGTAVFSLLEPDCMKCLHWIPPIGCSITHEFIEMLVYGFILAFFSDLRIARYPDMKRELIMDSGLTARH